MLIYTGWFSFCAATKVPAPDLLFVQLCLQKSEPEAVFRDFLDDYVKFSEEIAPCLDPELEYISSCSVQSALTVREFWKLLLLAADKRVIDKMRRENEGKYL
ncbi:hypothetical protein V8F06_000690 [Rhypophila decipiens]